MLGQGPPFVGPVPIRHAFICALLSSLSLDISFSLRLCFSLSLLCMCSSASRYLTAPQMDPYT